MISLTLATVPGAPGWHRITFFSGKRRLGRPAIIPDVRAVATPEGRADVAKLVGALYDLTCTSRRSATGES